MMEKYEIIWHLEKMLEWVISERNAWESRKMHESWKICETYDLLWILNFL